MPEINLPTYAQQEAILEKLSNTPQSVGDSLPTGHFVTVENSSTNTLSIISEPSMSTPVWGLELSTFNGINPLSTMPVMPTYSASGTNIRWVSNDNFIVKLEAVTTSATLKVAVFKLNADGSTTVIHNSVKSVSMSPSTFYGLHAVIDNNDTLHIMFLGSGTGYCAYYYCVLPSVVSDITLVYQSITPNGTSSSITSGCSITFHDRAKNIFKIGVGNNDGGSNALLEIDMTNKTVTVNKSFPTSTAFKPSDQAKVLIKELSNGYWLTDNNYILELSTLKYTRIPVEFNFNTRYEVIEYNGRLYGVMYTGDMVFIVLLTFNLSDKNATFTPLHSFRLGMNAVQSPLPSWQRVFTNRNNVYFTSLFRRDIYSQAVSARNLYTFNITDKLKEAEAKIK